MASSAAGNTTAVVSCDDGLAGEVFSASRDGDISRLRSLVDGRDKDEVRSMVACKTNSASALIMACRNGHAAVVSFLVTRCHADIEQTGSVTFDGEVQFYTSCHVSSRSVKKVCVCVGGVLSQNVTTLSNSLIIYTAGRARTVNTVFLNEESVPPTTR